MKVHAGLAPDLPLDDQDLWAMYKMRNLAPASDAVAAAAVPEGKTRAVSKRRVMLPALLPPIAIQSSIRVILPSQMVCSGERQAWREGLGSSLARTLPCIFWWVTEWLDERQTKNLFACSSTASSQFSFQPSST